MTTVTGNIATGHTYDYIQGTYGDQIINLNQGSFSTSGNIGHWSNGSTDGYITKSTPFSSVGTGSITNIEIDKTSASAHSSLNFSNLPYLDYTGEFANKILNGLDIFDAGDTFNIVNNGKAVFNTLSGNDNYTSTGTGIDIIASNGGADIIHTGGGNDILEGGGGNDDLYGEDGNDIIYANQGLIADTYHTSGGPNNGVDDDYANGGAGDDVIYFAGPKEPMASSNYDSGDSTGYATGGAGNDTIYGGVEGDDEFHGGSGNDIIYGEFGNDLIYGEDDNDFLSGGAGSDTIYGGNGNDSIHSGLRKFGDNYHEVLTNQTDGTGNDWLSGNAGDDILYYESNNVVGYGGSGSDTFIFKDITTNQVLTQGQSIKDFSTGDKINLSFLEGIGDRNDLSIQYSANGYEVRDNPANTDSHDDFFFRVVSDHSLTSSDFIF